VDLYKQIRYLFVHENLSQRAIARQLGISRNTVKRYCGGEQVPWQRRGLSGRQRYVITEEMLAFIKDCLAEDVEEDISKQKHTAKKIYDRLVEEKNFHGGQSTVREIVSALKDKPNKVFIPLSFEPGEAIQIDWGEITAYLAKQKVKLQIFCMRECYSADIFVKVFFRQNEESFLEAQIEGLLFFGGAPGKMIFDNAKIAVKEGFGAHAKMQARYAAMAAHYAFDCDFCNISAAHEKGLVEGLVGWARRNIFVPIPRVETIDELNVEVHKRCLAYRKHKISGREQTVGEMALTAREAMVRLPPYSFDPGRIVTGMVNSFSTLRFECNNYSVPVQYAGKEVSVKGYGNEILIYYRHKELARYPRCYEKNKTIYRLEHYLDLIEQRPRSVFNAKPVKDNLSAQILAAGKRLSGPKEMVKLLKLCVEQGQNRVLEAIAMIKSPDLSIEQILAYLVPVHQVEPLSLPDEVKVKKPQFKSYDQLIRKGADL